MVIRKMNRIFDRHGRFLFGVITAVIIVTFVGFLTPGFFDFLMPGYRSEKSAAGSIFDQKITYEELKKQSLDTAIGYSLLFGGFSPMVSFIQEKAKADAFNDICISRAAERRGISISDEQIAEFIRELPSFQNKGRFAMEKYKNYLSRVLAPAGLDNTDLEDAVRNLLLREQLREQFIKSVIITPGEVKCYFDCTYEKFDVKTARFRAEDFMSKIKVDKKEAEAYYNTNGNEFMLPPEFDTCTACLKYDSFRKEAETAVNEDALKKYYETNKARYTEKGKTLPFKEVKGRIKSEMISAGEKQAAMRKAQLFAVEAYKITAEFKEDGKNPLDAFEKLARQKNIPAVKTGWFNGDSKIIKNIGEAPELAKTLAQDYHQITNAIEGKKAAYVVFTINRKEERPAEFKDVEAKAEEKVKRAKAVQLAREKAREVALELTEAKDKSEILKKYKFEKTDTFMAKIKQWAPYGPDGKIIAALAEKTPAGSVAPVENTSYGAIAVYVEKRTPPDTAEFEKDKKNIEAAYKMQKQKLAWFSYHSWIMSRAKYNMKK